MRVTGATLAAWLAASAVLAAHEGGPPASPSAWDLLAAAGLCLTAVLYASGRHALPPEARRRTRLASAAFWSGWAAMLVAVLPPLDRLAIERFSAHMLQHELLMLVGAPLMIAGRPLATALPGLPARVRARVASALQAPATGGAWRALTAPLAAWALHGLAVWLWHVPALYEAAVRDEAVHAVQHATFVGTAALFWSGLIYGRYGRAGYGASVFYVFTTLVHTGLLGAVFTLASAPLYPHYAARTPDPLGDQQVAGLVMWIPAGLVLTLTGLALFAAWLGDTRRRAVGAGPAGRYADAASASTDSTTAPGRSNTSSSPIGAAERRIGRGCSP
jgi:putative membrane protein